MKKIIVASDLSPESTESFPLAASLAASYGASLVLITVLEDPVEAAFNVSLDFPVLPTPDIKNELQQRLQQSLEDLRQKHFSSVKSEAVVIEGQAPIHHEIIKFAQSSAADLIVMTTHGRTGVSHLLIGSVAERAVRESRCPVLVVPCKKK